MAVSIRSLSAGDWPAVAAIYREGIEGGDATFETDVPTWEAWNESRLPGHQLVAELDGVVVGFAALTPTSRRAVYAGVAEDGVYVAGAAQGRGIGRLLLEALVTGAEAAGIWTIQASVFPENEASLALHARCGFRVVGRRERIACLEGRWRDTILLERRSRTT